MSTHEKEKCSMTSKPAPQQISETPAYRKIKRQLEKLVEDALTSDLTAGRALAKALTVETAQVIAMILKPEKLAAPDKPAAEFGEIMRQEVILQAQRIVKIHNEKKGNVHNERLSKTQH